MPLLLLAMAHLALAQEPAVRAVSGLRTVILDPGHGGSDDPGVAGKSGISEADIAFDICRRIARNFEERLGTQRVVLTRARDGAPDIPTRTSIANGRKGDVLVSIHVGHGHETGPPGPRIYIMDQTLRVVELAERRLRPRARRLVTGEAPAAHETDLKLTPWTLAQQEWVPRSAALAMSIARELDEQSGSRPPITELPLALLAGARMPAVMIEVGDISQPEDEEALQSDRRREALAQAVFRAINSFGTPAMPPAMVPTIR